MASCAKKEGLDRKVLAKIGNKTVTVGEFRKKLAKLPPYYQGVVSNNKKRYLDEMALEMLLYEDAVRKGVDKAQDVKEVIADAKKKVVIAKHIKNEIDDNVKVSEKDIEDFYAANKDKFQSPEMWRASHILVPDEAAAKRIHAELALGAAFEELAKANSTDATANRGGDVGFFRAGTLVPDFEKACMKLDIGQTSDIVRTQFGYHIIKLTDKRPPKPREFGEVREMIAAELTRERRNEAFEAMVLDLKTRYGVEMREDTLHELEASESAAPSPAPGAGTGSPTDGTGSAG